MSRSLLSLFAASFLFFTAACHADPSDTPDTPSTPDPEPTPDAFYARGADISWVTEMEDQGYLFYNAEGEARECTALMKELGFNAVRYRVWVNPADGYNSNDDVLVKALRAQALGLKIMIDFHYSDTWADPGHQTVPAAWKDYTPTSMASAVAAHTKETLTLLKEQGVEVSWVQVGNEVTGGMLWPSGRVSGSDIGSFGTYFQAGYEAVKSVYPDAQVVLHIDNGWKLSTVKWFFDLMKTNSVVYDMVGLSLYPSYWDDATSSYPDWRTKASQLVSTAASVSTLYGKPVMLTEFGMPVADPEKARAALSYLLEQTSTLDNFCGIFLWEPESEPARNHYAYGAFKDGRPTSALDPINQ